MSYFTLGKIDAIDSTNEELKRRYKLEKIVHGDILWALDQTKGKGQRAANWVSQPSKNITFSIFLSQKELQLASPFQLNCLVAMAIESALNNLDIPSVKIKWPNDILSANKKIAGILIENLYRGSQLNASIVGIGLNVNQENFIDLPHASSMKLCGGVSYELEQVLDTILVELESKFTIKEGFETTLHTFAQNLYGFGEQLNFHYQNKPIVGTIRGVMPDGRLILAHPNGEVKNYNFKEIRLVY